MDKKTKKDNGELKLIIYQDDNDEVKERLANISKNEFGVEIQLIHKDTKEEIGVRFEIPWARILKIKEVKE